MTVIHSRQTGAALTLAAIVVVIYGMQAAQVLLVPFLLAVFLALITVRPMLWMQRRRVPAVIAVLLIVSTMVLVLSAIAAILGTSIADFTAALPEYQERLDVITAQGLDFAARFVEDGAAIENLSDLIDAGWAMGLAANLLNGLREVLTDAFLILFTTVFILLEASGFSTKFRAAFGRRNDTFVQAQRFLQNLGRYLGIKTFVSVLTGVTAGLLTHWIGLDFPLLWGMFAFLLNYIPTIGSIIAAVPAVLLALVQLGPPEAFATALAFLGLNVVFGTILEPRLLGYGVGISPLVVFIGLVFWGWVFGPVGMLLSVPLTMTLKMALEHNPDTRWLAILIGSERDAAFALQSRAAAEAA